jgi:hypothetical protein
VEALDRFVEGGERADLVDRAERAAAREGEPDGWLRGRLGTRALQALDARLQLGHLARERAHVLRARHAEPGDRRADTRLEHFSRWETASTVRVRVVLMPATSALRAAIV